MSPVILCHVQLQPFCSRDEFVSRMTKKNFMLGFLVHKEGGKFCLCLVLGGSNYSAFMQYLSPHQVTQGIRHLPFDLVFIEHT